MKNTYEVEGKLKIRERLKNSINGNPTYLVYIGDKVYRTVSDSAVGYSVYNYNGEDVRATVGYFRNKLYVEKIKKL